MWQLANLVSRLICEPRSLNQPVTRTPDDKRALLDTFQRLYDSFPQTLTNTSAEHSAQLAATNARAARQNLFLRSNYWHCMMIVHSDENVEYNVYCDAQGALQAGRLAIASFFSLWDNLRVDASVWWVFQHRAFEEAVRSF